MKSRKKLICLAVAAALVAGAMFTGCTVVNNEADVKRTVATVNIANSDAFAEFGDEYKSTVTEKVFLKRDMITAFYNGYSQLVQNGSSYATVFETIKENLVSNAIMTQYATAYLLRDKVENGGGSLADYNNCATEALKYEYILDEAAVKNAKYQLNVTLNSVLDSSEQDILDEESDDEYTGTDTRSTPTGIDATVEDYVPENYNVYTGYEGYLLENAGDGYEPLDGTTKVTRRKAYSAFLNSLRSNYLVTAEDMETTDIWEVSYVKESYVSQLQSEILSAFNDKIVEEKEKVIEAVVDGKYTYIQGLYDSQYAVQEKDYDNRSTFETAMGNMSDTSFILYSPTTKQGETDTENRTYGYVYNILLPFSSAQTAQLGVQQSYRDNDIISESEYFINRNNIMKNIETTDQRAAWFNGSTDYSFSVKEYEEESGKTLDYFGKDKGRDYLFFKNNVTDTEHEQYEALEKYDGRYAYNGTVRKNTNGSYTLIPNKLGIDGMLGEFKAYLDYVLGDGSVDYTVNDRYYTYEVNEYTIGDTKEVDYSKLVYASGKVSLGADANKENMFNAETNRYKAMAAVNELQYAYTTDTGVLSQYIGYTVSAYDTSYIKEFEYAAQEAVKEGAGTFKVCAGDYGWHLIYVTDTFKVEGGAAYNPDFTTDRVEKEGTFENRFYNWKKDSELANEATLKQNTVLKNYNNDKSVKVYKEVYKDLSGLK